MCLQANMSRAFLITHLQYSTNRLDIGMLVVGDALKELAEIKGSIY